MSLSEINIREKEFHNKLVVSGNDRKENKFYKAINNIYLDFFDFLKSEVKDKNILDFGCGNGGYVKKVNNFGPSKIIAIDISDEAIDYAKKINKENENIEFRVENCENTKLKSNQFDLIYGAGILHHLDLMKSFREINRLLKKDGSLIFIEPLGTNPIINLYRMFTPNSRSKDEHPFNFKDIKSLNKLFKKVEISYYGFFTLIGLPFYKKAENSKIFTILSKIDKFFLNIPFFRFLAWSILIKAKKI